MIGRIKVMQVKNELWTDVCPRTIRAACDAIDELLAAYDRVQADLIRVQIERGEAASIVAALAHAPDAASMAAIREKATEYLVEHGGIF